MLITSYSNWVCMKSFIECTSSEIIALISKLHSKNSFVTELNIVIMLLCMCLQAYSTFIVSSPDHTLCYAKVGLVTLVDFLGVDLFLCRNSCRANQIAGRAIIT